MSTKDNLLNLGLLAAGGAAIAAASGVYGKGSRAKRAEQDGAYPGFPTIEELRKRAIEYVKTQYKWTPTSVTLEGRLFVARGTAGKIVRVEPIIRLDWFSDLSSDLSLASKRASDSDAYLLDIIRRHRIFDATGRGYQHYGPTIKKVDADEAGVAFKVTAAELAKYRAGER
jgi:hypothetical protein